LLPSAANDERLNSIVPQETPDAHELAPPSQPEFENHQLQLFQSFLANGEEQRDHLSNAIDLWDSVPRYSVSRQEMTKARISERFLEEHKTRFQHRGHAYTVIVYPARVMDLDGVKRDFWPSASEELVEDALRKLAIEQQAGFFDQANGRSGVVFTLHALRKEMERRGHARSYQQIVQSLNILSQSIIDIMPEGGQGEGKIRSAYLPSLAAVSRKRLKDDPEAKWAVQFHPLVTGAIDRMTHRQYNYHLMMSHGTQLARWLHKQLVLKYTFADQFKPFQMRFSTVKRDSGLLDAYARDRDAVKALEAAFGELQKGSVIQSVTRNDETGPRKKLTDVVFTVRSSFEFVRETKAANKRQQLAHSKPGTETDPPPPAKPRR
jgi:hypothetical protein